MASRALSPIEVEEEIVDDTGDAGSNVVTLHVGDEFRLGGQFASMQLFTAVDDCAFADRFVAVLSPDQNFSFYFLRKGDAIAIYSDYLGLSTRTKERLNADVIRCAAKEAATLEDFLTAVSGDNAQCKPQQYSVGVAARMLPSLHANGAYLWNELGSNEQRCEFADAYAAQLDRILENYLGVSLGQIVSNPHASELKTDMLVDSKVEVTRPYVSRGDVLVRMGQHRALLATLTGG